MQIAISIALAVVALLLFMAWRIRLIASELLNVLAAIGGIVAGLAAVILFVVPATQSLPQLPEPLPTVPPTATLILPTTSLPQFTPASTTHIVVKTETEVNPIETKVSLGESNQTFQPFISEFNESKLDLALWENVGVPAMVKDGKLKIKGIGENNPLIYTRHNPFPTSGGFSANIAFRYTAGAYWSQIIVIGTEEPALGRQLIENDFNQYLICVIQDGQSYNLTIFFQGQKIYIADKLDLASHTLEMQYDGKYAISLDGNLIYTSPRTTYIPSSIWLGEPRIAPGKWSGLEVDYIRIIALPSS